MTAVTNLPTSQTLPITEAARILGVSPHTLYEAIRRGQIPGGHQIAGRYVIARAPFQKWWNGELDTKPARRLHAV